MKIEAQMILSNGKPSDIKSLDSKALANEERAFFSRYKTAYRNTLGCRDSNKFYQALELEIVAFNNWRNLYDERVRRDSNAKIF